MVTIAMYNKRQLIVAIVHVSLFIIATSVIVVVLIDQSKHRMNSVEHVAEKLTVTFSTIITIYFECSPEHRGYCWNGGKCLRLTDSLVVANFFKNLHSSKSCDKLLWFYWRTEKFFSSDLNVIHGCFFTKRLFCRKMISEIHPLGKLPTCRSLQKSLNFLWKMQSSRSMTQRVLLKKCWLYFSFAWSQQRFFKGETTSRVLLIDHRYLFALEFSTNLLSMHTPKTFSINYSWAFVCNQYLSINQNQSWWSRVKEECLILIPTVHCKAHPLTSFQRFWSYCLINQFFILKELSVRGAD